MRIDWNANIFVLYGSIVENFKSSYQIFEWRMVPFWSMQGDIILADREPIEIFLKNFITKVNPTYIDVVLEFGF